MLATMLTNYLDSLGIQYGNPEDEAFVSHDGIGAAPSLYAQCVNSNISIFLGFRGLPPYIQRDISDPCSSKVFLVRNPLDVVVSRYFQFYQFSAGGHARSESAEYNDKMTEIENLHAHLSIDQVALADAQAVVEEFESIYECISSPGSNHMIFQYESILFNKPHALICMMRFMGLPCNETQAVVSAIASDVRIEPGMNRIGSHVRSVIPGDHVNHLSSSTIDSLSTIFRDTVRPFGYYL